MSTSSLEFLLHGCIKLISGSSEKIFQLIGVQLVAQRLLCLLVEDGFSQRDAKRAAFVTELLEKYLEPYLTYLEQVSLFS